MRDAVRGALDAGAVGLATSFAPTHRGVDGKPVPSRHADRAEFEALFHVLREVGRGIGMVTPGDVVGPDELFDLQLALGVPVTMSALLALPDGAHRHLAERAAASRAAGGQVWPQVSPRPICSASPIGAGWCQVHGPTSWCSIPRRWRPVRSGGWPFPAGSERLTADEPVGVRHVLVNGVPIRVDGVQDLTARSGQLVRSVPRS